MINKYCENLLIRLGDRKKVYGNRILSGTFSTLDEYKLLVGKFKGMEEAEIEIKALYKDMFDEKQLNIEGKEDEEG